MRSGQGTSQAECRAGGSTAWRHRTCVEVTEAGGAGWPAQVHHRCRWSARSQTHVHVTPAWEYVAVRVTCRNQPPCLV